MKKNLLFLYILLGICVMPFASCQDYENIASETPQNGQFSVEYPQAYSISMTREATPVQKRTQTTTNGKIEISESEWGCNLANRTRSAGIGDIVDWENTPSVGLYVSGNSGEMKLKNIPLNPLAHTIQNYRYDESKKNSYEDEFASIKVEDIPSASFFWDSWTEREKMPTDGANFYGIYPRPFDHFPNAIWNYTRNSVISSSSVDDDDNCISYVFWEAQTDQNIKQFDLMYSKSEAASNDGIYGNQNKKNGESILMPFVHAFSLLDIKIYKGENYTGAGLLSAISVKGTDVSTSGKLNYVTGELTKGTDEGTINRTITETVLNKDVPFQTEIIVPPSSDATPSTDGKESISIVCKIDGSEYKYSFPDDLKLKSGNKYNVKLTLSPSGLSYMNVWYGAHVTLDDNTTTLDYGSTTISGNKEFSVSIDEGYNKVKVLKNGEPLASTDEGKYTIDKNCTYNIVASPMKEWYAATEDMRVHFDGIKNTAYKTSQDKGVSVWQDLTGNGNDGNLKLFDGTAESGWNGKDGLVFDGIDDIVIFPGNINAEEYTMEFCLAFDTQKSSATPRLNAEGTAYPAYYLRKMSSDKKWHVGLFGHNCPQYDSDVTIEEDNSMVQLDMVYKDKTIKFYKNGVLVNIFSGTRQDGSIINLKDAVSIPEASLGNRSADNTRTTTGTYHSYILYDRALDKDDILNNFNVNRNRYGMTR